MRKLTLYRDDSTTQVVFENVKHWFWTAGNSVLTIAQYTDVATGAHKYINWPRERFCWFKDEKMEVGVEVKKVVPGTLVHPLEVDWAGKEAREHMWRVRGYRGECDCWHCKEYLERYGRSTTSLRVEDFPEFS